MILLADYTRTVRITETGWVEKELRPKANKKGNPPQRIAFNVMIDDLVK